MHYLLKAVPLHATFIMVGDVNQLPSVGAGNVLQVLTPMHKGSIGAGNLNTELQAVLNPTGQEMTRGGRNFRVNDKVMQIKNNCDKEVFNGDIGRIVQIDQEAQEVSIVFDGREVAYDFTDLVGGHQEGSGYCREEQQDTDAVYEIEIEVDPSHSESHMTSDCHVAI
jgi:ATP-dependent exoDNAse (exonuclease V) alpha subunit